MTNVINSLEEVLIQYSKEELKEIAKAFSFGGYSKYNKKELAEWLKDQMLDGAAMEKIFSRAKEDEIELFESAIEEEGIVVTQDLIANSLILSSYGAYNTQTNQYRIPKDVQEKYQEICTPELRAEQGERNRFRDYCNAAIYLYGVLPLEKFVEICSGYEKKELDLEEMKALIAQFHEEEERCLLKDEFLMDEDLEEDEVFRDVLRVQGQHSYYIPETAEEFLEYGRLECQEPNIQTVRFLEYLFEKQHLDGSKALRAFYELQDGIRMNESMEEMASFLIEQGCTIASQKDMQEMAEAIRNLRRFTRTWDYKGHTEDEVMPQMTPIVKNKKVYPNDPCTCGSGKKYKHCCGRKK